MAHFAKIENNKVIDVLVVSNDVIIESNGEESELKGINFLKSLTGHKNWVQTSYNNNFRNKFAGIGDYYDVEKDAFIGEKPFPSWVFNENTLHWESPIPRPVDGHYMWVESDLAWRKIINE